MPNRIAMGAATWWEPVVAVVLTLAAIAGLVVLGGRVYTGAILHTGPTLKLREAWRGTPAPRRGVLESDPGSASTRTSVAAVRPTPWTTWTSERTANGILIAITAAVGGAVIVLTHDFVIGLAVGAGSYAVASQAPQRATPCSSLMTVPLPVAGRAACGGRWSRRTTPRGPTGS